MLFAGLFAVSADALAGKKAGTTIKKCQDAEGRWHYGDTTAQECAESKVTEIDERGVKVKETDAPPSAGEIKAREDAKVRAEQERIQAAEQKRLDDRLLATYEDATAIIRARDERVRYIDDAITINNELIANLEARLGRLRERAKGVQDKKLSAELADNIARTEAQITEYVEVNAERKRERERITQKYNLELARYREITQRRKNGRATGTAGNRGQATK